MLNDFPSGPSPWAIARQVGTCPSGKKYKHEISVYMFYEYIIHRIHVHLWSYSKV